MQAELGLHKHSQNNVRSKEVRGRAMNGTGDEGTNYCRENENNFVGKIDNTPTASFMFQNIFHNNF